MAVVFGAVRGRRCNRALAFAVPLFWLLAFALSNCRAADAPSVILALRTAIGAISTVEAHFTAYFSGLEGPGIITGPSNFGKWSQFSWGWDRQGEREYVDGNYAWKRPANSIYLDMQAAYDGKTLRTLDKTFGRGLVKERGDMFDVWASPLVLLGKNLDAEKRRDLVDLIDNAKLLTLPGTAPNQYILESEFQVGDLEYVIRVWVDKNAGYLPRRIELSRKFMKTVMTLIENEDIREADGNVWFPIRGRVTRYYVVTPTVYPGGRTLADVQKLPREKAVDVLGQVKWETRPLGFGTEMFVTDASSLRINQAIEPARFTLEHPRGTKVFNELENRGYVVGEPDALDEEPGHPVRTAFFIANAVVIVCIIALIVVRRKRRTSHAPR
jgi:outer membrane lipoprotein-sorting protein